jgi:FHS family Na+ dependent glucose MFS transporter 1
MTKKAQIIGYFGVYFSLGAVIASLGPTLPSLAQNVQVGIAAISILFTARSLGYLGGSLLGGYLYDHYNGHRVLAGLLTLSAASFALVPAMRDIVWLAILFFFLGVNLGGLDVGANTLLPRTRREKVGAYLNAMFFFAGLGGFITPLYLGATTLSHGYEGIALFLVLLALWVFFLPSPKIANRQAAENIRLKDYTPFVAFTFLAFLFIGAETSYGGWLFTYFKSSGLGSEKAAYTLTSVFWLSVMFGRLLAIPVAARFKLDKIITVYLIGATCNAAILYFLRDSAFAVWLGSVGMGVSIAALFPSTYTLIQQKMSLSGKLTGIVWAMGSLGAMFIPWFIGQEIDARGAASMMLIMLVIWILALSIFFAALRAPKSS